MLNLSNMVLNKSGEYVSEEAIRIKLGKDRLPNSHFIKVGGILCLAENDCLPKIYKYRLFCEYKSGFKFFTYTYHNKRVYFTDLRSYNTTYNILNYEVESIFQLPEEWAAPNNYSLAVSKGGAIKLIQKSTIRYIVDKNGEPLVGEFVGA